MRQKLTLAYKLRSTAVVTTCSLGAMVGIGIYRNNEKFYNDVLMPLVQLCPPEMCHRLAVLGFKYNLFPRQKLPDSDLLKTKFLNFTLTNPLGIAAGFDKHGEAVDGLHRVGFGFVEIGSVTPEPQPGNEKPRVFRLIDDKAIVNRYGFNSDGHDRVFERLQQLKQTQPNIILGVNLGKNKATEHAHDDYTKGIVKFASVADYFVINVSSPNTAGLRNLQQGDNLKLLLSKVVETRNKLAESSKQRTPVLLKLAPDLSDADLKEITSVISKKECRIDGLIVSNTTIERSATLKSPEKSETGGLSGEPLRERSTILIAKLYNLTGGQVPIIGVGGISTGQDAYEKITAGASALQLYTALIFHGPPIVSKIKTELNALLETNGIKSIDAARGSEAKAIAKRKITE